MAATPLYNFSAGPAILPPSVFERAAEAVRELKGRGHASDAPGIGLSLLEISHRSPDFGSIHEAATELVHAVLGIPQTHQVLLLQGGASQQFAMLPLNFATPGGRVGYVDTGAWASKAIKESKVVAAGPGRGHETAVIASSAATGFDRVPVLDKAALAGLEGADYLHLTTNNTIYGTELEDLPEAGLLPRAKGGEGSLPLILDASSNIGSRALGLERASIGYAGAQKNLGPSGVTLVWIDRSWLEREVPAGVPAIFRYQTHAAKGSLYNTPNTFGTLVLKLVLEWMRDKGGVAAIAADNAAKAAALYDLLDASTLFEGHAQPSSRSRMNVTWTLGGAPEAERTAITERFLSEAAAAGFSGIKGHRSVGGCRASIYNAFPRAGVDALCVFMREFERKS